MSPATSEELERAPTVLVIDDDEAVHESLEMLLEVYGYQVVVARDGRQGLAAFRARAPDFVLIDLVMPVMDGMETIARLRRECPDVCIVAMSSGPGIGNWGSLAAARKLGASHAIEKPFEPEKLLALLRDPTPST